MLLSSHTHFNSVTMTCRIFATFHGTSDLSSFERLYTHSLLHLVLQKHSITHPTIKGCCWLMYWVGNQPPCATLMPTMHNLLIYRSRLRSQKAYIRILICEVNRVDSMAAAENDCIQSKLPLILHCQLHSRFTAALTLHSYNITQLVKIYCACAKLAQTHPCDVSHSTSVI